MSFDKHQFEAMVRDSLEWLHDDIPVTDSAVNLLLGTAAQESHFGKYLRQLGGGPALGVFQMEPATHNDIWQNFIAHRRNLKFTLNFMGYEQDSRHLVYDLRYATIMARIHYFRVPAALPDSHDLDSLAGYWKAFYNTNLGAGTPEEFERNYKLFDL